MSEMIERTSFDTPTLPRLGTIIAELQRGVWTIPAFQRPFVWRDEQRLALLDSIIKGLPIGSLLVWRSTRHKLGVYPTIADVPVPETRAGVEKSTYLIDGHQRISTLFGALVKPTTERKGKDAKRWPLYYELGTSDSPAFRLPPRGQPPLHWLPLDILLDGKALYKFRDRLFQAKQDDKAEEAERIANVFKDYILPVVPLVTDNLDLVTDAFVRINSQGADMTEAHMLRALTHLKEDIDTDRGFAQIRKALGSIGWGDIPDQTLVNSLKASFGLDVYRSSVTNLKKELEARPDALRRLGDALTEAIDLLRSFGVAGWAALPYSYQLVTLSALAYDKAGALRGREQTLRAWFFRTTYSEHFTGQTGGQIRREIDELAACEPGADSSIALGGQVARLRSLRKGTVRTKAFLLFLANAPADAEARARRQQVLAFDAKRPIPTLFVKHGSDPGNVVIADPSELRVLRVELGRGEVSRERADELVIPDEVLNLATDQEALIRRRGEIVLRAEEDLIRSLGLSLGEDTDDDSAGDDGLDLSD